MKNKCKFKIGIDSSNEYFYKFENFKISFYCGMPCFLFYNGIKLDIPDKLLLKLCKKINIVNEKEKNAINEKVLKEALNNLKKEF